MGQLTRYRPSAGVVIGVIALVVATSGSAFVDNAGGTLVDFVNAPDVWMGYLIDAIFMPGTTTPCAASLLVNPS